MVNLRLLDCETQISNFETETETPRCKMTRKKDFETNTSEISLSGQNWKNHSIPLKEV